MPARYRIEFADGSSFHFKYKGRWLCDGRSPETLASEVVLRRYADTETVVRVVRLGKKREVVWQRGCGLLVAQEVARW